MAKEKDEESSSKSTKAVIFTVSSITIFFILCIIFIIVMKGRKAAVAPSVGVEIPVEKPDEPIETKADASRAETNLRVQTLLHGYP